MTRAAALLLLAGAAAPAQAQAQTGPAPVAGRWVTQNGHALVEIGPCGPARGAALCGRIARVLVRTDGPATDRNNPDASLRGRPLVGVDILSGFAADGDRWRGRIYDPESGRTYRSELRREGALLKVKGCFGPFCRTQDWRRAG